MEMSVGTIVTIVLLMSVLVLGIFLVQKVFDSGTGAVDAIDDQVQSEINKLFADKDMPLVILPPSGAITVKKGKGISGFAFSVENSAPEKRTFTWKVEAVSTFDFSNCGSSMTKEKADSYIILSEGSFPVSASSKLKRAVLVKFDVPETALSCKIPYDLTVESGDDFSEFATIYVDIV